MDAFITGGTGFVGTYLSRFLLEKGHSVTVLARREVKGPHFPARVRQVIGDGTKQGLWQDEVAGHDVVINLAGTSIFKRWNEDYKRRLRESRILTTRHVVEALPANPGGDVVFLSTSAIGYYGFTTDQELYEDSPAGTDFLAGLALDWETEALLAEKKGVRTVITRFGVVLGNDGGALAQITLPFKFFVGGPIGSGRQWVSWIHINDLARAMLFCMETKEINGPVNFTARNRLEAPIWLRRSVGPYAVPISCRHRAS
ncbi:MAG: TIGR01777 family oxidoreductase [Pseudomonadota bacterium]